MGNIHKTAIIDPKAEIDSTVDIGPNVIIDKNVRIGPDTKIFAGAYITGHTTIGRNNEIHMGSIIGHDPQDFAFDKNIISFVEIGNYNIIREYCTIHRGTKPETKTLIGNNNYLMGGTHVAHNVSIGNNVITANYAVFGGYVTIDDNAFISGGAMVHQFVRIGRLAILSGNSRFSHDLPPFLMGLERNSVAGVNIVGLRRAGITKQAVKEIKKAYTLLYLSGLLLQKALEKMEAEKFKTEEAVEFISFLKSRKRPVARHRKKTSSD